MKMASFVRISLVSCGLAIAAPVAAQPASDASPPAADNGKGKAVALPAAPESRPAATANKPGPAPTPAGAAASSGNILVEKTGGGQKLFRITEGLVVEGQRQKPNAFYVLQRAGTPYDWEALEENFLPRILKAVDKPPF